MKIQPDTFRSQSFLIAEPNVSLCIFSSPTFFSSSLPLAIPQIPLNSFTCLQAQTDKQFLLRYLVLWSKLKVKIKLSRSLFYTSCYFTLLSKLPMCWCSWRTNRECQRDCKSWILGTPLLNEILSPRLSSQAVNEERKVLKEGILRNQMNREFPALTKSEVERELNHRLSLFLFGNMNKEAYHKSVA